MEAGRADFEGLWAEMPVEVPWTGPIPRFGPPKLKKVEVLEAWAGTLASYSESLPAPKRGEIFGEALALYPRALALPLDRFELWALIGQLDRADALAPSQADLLELWKIKDQFYEAWLSAAGNSPEVWLAWGQESLQRADLQPDGRIFRYHVEEAERKLERYAQGSEEKARAYHEWGARIEARANLQPGEAALGTPEEAEERLVRLRLLCDKAQARYRRAYELEPQRPEHARSMGRILLKIAALGPKGTFQATYDESRRYASLAINADPDSAEAWFTRGGDLMEAGNLAKIAPEIADALVAEALAAFQQYLRANNNRVDHLRSMADQVWRAAESSPAHRVASLTALSDICARLIALSPSNPEYHFARALTLYSLLAATPDWPDDWAFSESDYAKTSFTLALASFRDGLELLSRSSLPAIRPWEIDPGELEAGPPVAYSQDQRGELLAGAWSPGAALRSASFQERLATILNRQIERLVSTMRPEALPPWYKLRLAGFFRRVGSTGYPPAEDQMAFYRLAEILLIQAEREYHGPDDPALRRSRFASILAERGLLMAEMSRVALGDVDFLLSEAERHWTGAEAASPGASRYALARWTAWSGNAELLRPLLRHSAEQQDHFLWPTFQEAAYEPSFAPFHSQPWFKNAWFGYSR